MPLPKTATIAARATEVYCETWSVILQRICKMPPTRSSDLDDLSQLLPYLRQLLTCCACAGLLDNPVISLTCGHCYCYECQFREPLLKIQCRQCRERTGLVIENQLQLIVKGYRHMCYIIGEELRKNPSCLGAKRTELKKDPSTPDLDSKKDISVPEVMKSEPKDPEGNEGQVGSKDPSAPEDVEESCETIAVSVDKVKNEKVETALLKSSLSTSKKKGNNSIIVDPNFDPIAEIVREVEKGMKVSRAILIVKPPLKYLNSKITISTSKKEPTSTTTTAAAKKPTPSVSSTQANGSDESSTSVSNPGEGLECSTGIIAIGNGAGKVHKRPKKFPSNGKQKRIVKKAASKLAVKRSIAHREKIAGVKPIEKSSKAKKTVPVPSHKQDSQPLSEPKSKRIRTAAKSKPKSKAKGSTQSTSGGAAADVSSESAIISAASKSESLEDSFAFFADIRIDSLSVSKHCLNDSYLKINSDTISLLPHEEPSHILTETFDRLSSEAEKKGLSKKTSFLGGDWKKSTRKRKWGPLCPSVIVKRPRETIAKMLMMQCKAARGKKKALQRALLMQKHVSSLAKQATETTAKKKSSSSSGARRKVTTPSSRAVPVTPPSHVSPSRLPRPPPSVAGGDIPLPDDIPILSGDGSQDMMMDDVNWKELSDFLESNDDDSMSVLPLPSTPQTPQTPHTPHTPTNQGHFGRRPPPPPPPPPRQRPHPSFHPQHHGMPGPMHFNHPRDFPHHQRHFRPPPPFLPPPPHPPGHLHLPPHSPMTPHHHHPHHHRGTPMMPFPSRGLRPDMPPQDGFFPPMMGGAEMDFMPPRRLGPPDGGGGAGFVGPPLTPGGEMCPEGAYQHSPGRHHHPPPHLGPPPPGSHFPIQSPRLDFPPPPPPPPLPGGRNFPRPPGPMPPPSPSSVLKQEGSGNPMAQMVGKMTLKPSDQQQQQQQQPQKKKKQQKPKQPKQSPKVSSLSPSTGGTPKKRRSPGYSEAGWRCRCGTNNVMFPDKVCAKGKCPCYTKGIPCKNCLCRHCHNPFGPRKPNSSSTSSVVLPAEAESAEPAETGISEDPVKTEITDPVMNKGSDTIESVKGEITDTVKLENADPFESE